MREFKKLNLQLFAEDDKEVEQPVEEENTETEFDDTEGEGEEAETEVEAKEENPEDMQAKAEAEKKEASRQAYLRRQREKEAKQREEEKRASYVSGLKKSVGGINPFTGNKIVDAEDVEEYETMLELKELGKDPIEDYSSYLKEKSRKERKEREASAKAEQENSAKMKGELDDFVKAYGAEKVQEILNDKDFLDFGKDLINSGASPKLVYEKYLHITKKSDEKAEELLIEKDARRKSSPGQMKSSESKPKSFKDMNRDEFRDFYHSLLNN